MLSKLYSLAYLLAVLSSIQAIPAPWHTDSDSAIHNHHPHCRNLTYHVRASAVNKAIPSPAASSLSTMAGVNTFYAGLSAQLATASNRTVSGVYALSATYCSPPGGTQRHTPLQILVHGSTYTKEYWDRGAWGTGPPSYSWRQAMNRAGYATLAIDKLGNGGSSHPDPILDVQLPLQLQTIYTLLLRIKAGKANIGPRAPPKIIFVAHSSGCLIGATIAQQYPTALDALVLTGFPAAKANNPGGIPSYKYLPAALSAPTRFPPHLNPGYLLMNSELNRTAAFYWHGHYAPSIPHLDYRTQGPQPIGEAFSLGASSSPAFKGKVLVVTGQKDPA
ncbi:MAG: hypothetical protein Q9191_005443, partial [Dirinaria sp. TL-2023a]